MATQFSLMVCGIFFLSVPEFILLRVSPTKGTVFSASSQKIESLPQGLLLCVVVRTLLAGDTAWQAERGGYNKKARPSLEFDWNLDLRNCPRFKSPHSERTDGGVIQCLVSSALRH